MSPLLFPAPLPNPGEVHLWRVPLAPTESAAEAALAATLDPAERERAARFRAEPARRRYVAARGALRTLLGGYLGEPPEHVRLVPAPRGKPALAHDAGAPPLRFNLAHADDLAVVAIACGREVGVDVEPLARRVDALRIAGRYFAPEEAAALRALPPEEARLAFLRLWVCKEAMAKALGLGIAGCDLARLRVDFPPDSPPRAHPDALIGPEGAWTLRLLELEPGFLAGLAVSGGDVRVSSGEWPGGG